MTIADNSRFIKEIEDLFTARLPINLGVNKKNELVRLAYEISRAQNISIFEVFEHARIDEHVKSGRSGLFHRAKKALLAIRYPSLGPEEDPHIMPVNIGSDREERPAWDLKFEPKTIFIEKSVHDTEWTQRFIRNFSGAETVVIDNIREGAEGVPSSDPVTLYNSRLQNIFLVRNRSAFIKVCPCSAGCQRCGYWILNLGFGCPIDCAYCYLQTYSNSPGIVLPANIEDYYGYLRKFDDNSSEKIRIGTGEFTDSLALDKYTEYSSRFIPFFRKTRNLVLELKTKVSDIDNVLKEDPHDNVVISWSMNTRDAAEKYEKGGAGITERLDAASRAAKRGYRIGFHFDPIVYIDGWEKEYEALVGEIFSREEVRRNTAWISLGTLRYTPGLKQAAEQRFAENLMFYRGEFFMGPDGKLRYPGRLRVEMYKKMIGWIRSSDVSCWIYLCMEPEEVWKEINEGSVAPCFSRG